VVPRPNARRLQGCWLSESRALAADRRSLSPGAVPGFLAIPELDQAQVPEADLRPLSDQADAQRPRVHDLSLVDEYAVEEERQR